MLPSLLLMRLDGPPVMVFFVFWGYTITYLFVFFFIQFKLSKEPKRQRIQFKEDAIREGRMVMAHLDDYDISTHFENERSRFTADYIYTASDGNTHHYKTQWYAKWASTPPTTVPLYLYPDDYSKFYTSQELDMGKHSSRKGCLTLLVGLILYYGILQLVIFR